jgi:Domain of unknown function (DUF4267)
MPISGGLRRTPAAWVVLGMAGVFLLLGLAFIADAELGAAIFGIPAAEATGRSYVRALGLRDLALGLYLIGLTWFASRRAVGIVLGATLVIPAGDLLLILTQAGLSSPSHLLLHGLSALILRPWRSGSCGRMPRRQAWSANGCICLDHRDASDAWR